MISHNTIRRNQLNSSRNHGLKQTSESLLGNTTGIVSTHKQIDNNVNTTDYHKKIDSNKRKWKLKRYAEQLMPKHRTSFCQRHLGINSKTVDLYYNKDIENAHYQGLAHCDNVWTCPVCAATIAARRVSEVQHAVNNWHGSTVMLTYTMRHTRDDDPKILVDQLRQAMRFLYKGRKGRKLKKSIGWHGTITNLDVTYHDRNGFHIHIHQLVFLDPTKTDLPVMEDDKIQAFLDSEIGVMWIEALEKFNASADIEHGFKVTAGEQFNREYVAKFGRLPKDAKWTIANEVAHATSKYGKPSTTVERGFHPFQILEKTLGSNKSRWSKIWLTYVGFVRGRNQLTWSPNLKKYFGLDDMTDTDIMDAMEETTEGKHLICQIPVELWDKVLWFDLRCELLNITIRYQGERYELEQWFFDLNKRWRDCMKERYKTSSDDSWVKGTIWDYQNNKIRLDGEQ